MITPSFGLTATERVLPRLALDFTTASLDSRITFSRALNTATRINASGLVEVVNADVPRFDYNPTTLACNGLLIEESRINNLAYSEDFTNTSGWTPAQASVVSASIANPGGVLLSSELIEDSTANLHSVQTATGFSFTSGTSYTYSVFAKQGSGTRLLNLRPSNTTTFAANAVFNLQNGTVSSTALGTASIRSYGNGWYRCSVTGTAGATSSTGLLCFLVSTGTTINYQGDGTSSIYLWGAQLETGAFPTSYIPTTTTAVTRNADVATMTGTNISWLTAGAGSMYSEHDVYSINIKTQAVWQLGGGATTTSLRSPQTTTARLRAVVGGTFSALNAGAVISANTFKKAMVAWDGLSGRLQSGSVGEDITAAAILDATELSIGSLAGLSQLNGHVAKLMYWPYKLTTAELQAFST